MRKPSMTTQLAAVWGLLSLGVWAGCTGTIVEGRAEGYSLATSCPDGVTCPDLTSDGGSESVLNPPEGSLPPGSGGTSEGGTASGDGGTSGGTSGGAETPPGGGETPGGGTSGGGPLFCTYTQGGWGTLCHGGNPGCLRDRGFAAAFPNGLVVGVGNRITFTSSLAVQNFLPAGGPPAVLDQSYVDPTSTSAGVLAGQLTSVKLAVGLGDAGLMPQPTSVGSLRLNGGAFDGLTVRDLIDLADRAIGGDESALGGNSLSQLNDALTGINESFDGCQPL